MNRDVGGIQSLGHTRSLASYNCFWKVPVLVLIVNGDPYFRVKKLLQDLDKNSELDVNYRFCKTKNLTSSLLTNREQYR